MMKILRSNKYKILVITAVLLMTVPLASCFGPIGAKQQQQQPIITTTPWPKTLVDDVASIKGKIGDQTAALQEISNKLDAIGKRLDALEGKK